MLCRVEAFTAAYPSALLKCSLVSRCQSSRGSAQRSACKATAAEPHQSTRQDCGAVCPHARPRPLAAAGFTPWRMYFHASTQRRRAPADDAARAVHAHTT